MDQTHSYNGSLTAEQFLFYEIRIASKLYLEGKTIEEAIDIIKKDNLFQYPTERQISRLARACYKRLDALDNEQLVREIAFAPNEIAKQINLYAMMRYNRLVWEFMIQVIGEKYRNQDFSFTKKDLSAFFTRLQAQDDSVSSWSEATINKIKGGGYKKWYGYNEYMIDWYDDAAAIRAIKTAVIANYQYFMKPGLTWSTVTSGGFSLRKFGHGYIFDNGGCCVFELGSKANYILGVMNSIVFKYIFGQSNPTINSQSGEVAKFPVIIKQDNRIDTVVDENVAIAKMDWDSYETSWDFKRNPLV